MALEKVKKFLEKTAGERIVEAVKPKKENPPINQAGVDSANKLFGAQLLEASRKPDVIPDTLPGGVVNTNNGGINYDKLTKEDAKAIAAHIFPNQAGIITDAAQEVLNQQQYVQSGQYKKDFEEGVLNSKKQPYANALINEVPDLGQMRPQGATVDFLGRLTNKGSTVLSGAVSGALVGSIPGAAIGAFGGLLTGGIGAYSGTQLEATQNAGKTFEGSKKNIRSLLSGANKGMPAVSVVTAYNEEVNQIALAKSHLKWESRNSAIEAMSGARTKLIAIEAYERQLNEVIRPQLMQAILTPDPSKAEYYDQLAKMEEATQ